MVEHIVSRCAEPDSGGRMIDNIITNTLLPDLARQILNKSMDNAEFKTVECDYKDGQYQYAIN